LGLVLQSRRTVLGAAGTRIVDTVELNDIQFGQQNYNGLLTPLLNREDMDADGIIGLDGLQGQRVLLDFRAKRMALVDAHEKGANNGFEIIVTARRRSGQLILTNAKIDGVFTDVVIDTGSDTSIGNRALQRALSHQHQPVNTMLHSVTGQEIAASMVMADAMDLDRIHINNVAIAYADSPTFAALKLDKRPAILLGMRELRLFKRVAIDFTSRKVMFDMPFTVSNLPENMRSMHEGHVGQGMSPTANY
jgi:Aspartyl protease